MAFSFKFSADGSEFTRGLHKMKGEVKSFAKSAGGIMAATFIGGRSIQGLKKMGDELDRIGKLSIRFGSSVADIQKMGHAAELNGVTFEQLAKSMSKANLMAEESMGTNTRAREAFEAMGLSAEEFVGLSLGDQILAMSDGFIHAEESAKGLESANLLLGVSAKELIPFLKQGSSALKEQGESAAVASEKLIQQAQDFNDGVTNLKAKIANFFFFFSDRIQKITPLFVFFKDVFQNTVTFAIQGAVAVVSALWTGLSKIATGDFSGGMMTLADGADKVMAAFKQLGDSNFDSKDDLFDALNSADIKERKSGIDKGRVREDARKKLREGAKKRGADAKEKGEKKRAEKGVSDALKKAKSDLEKGGKNLEKLKGSSVDSGVIASGLRSIGGGGSAVVTRDPALQVAKRSQQILAQIAANTATAAAVEELTRTQQEF